MTQNPPSRSLPLLKSGKRTNTITRLHSDAGFVTHQKGSCFQSHWTLQMSAFLYVASFLRYSTLSIGEQVDNRDHAIHVLSASIRSQGVGRGDHSLRAYPHTATVAGRLDSCFRYVSLVSAARHVSANKSMEDLPIASSAS